MAVSNFDSIQLDNGITLGANAGSISVYHTGEIGAATTTQGTDTTPAVTETYVARVKIDFNCTLTGIAVLNGSAVAGNMIVGLFNSAGVLVASSASTAQSGTAAYQQVPFTATYAAKGPGLYFIGVQFNNTSARFRTHAIGNFTAFKKTGETYGTFTTLTSPNTFTTGVGPVADTY
jgi:hypothetical protein